MLDILKIAGRNLLRYKRRTLLTALLITVGLMAVLLFVAGAGSFKHMMVAQFTDAMAAHLQVHRRGYVGAMEALPVDRNMRPRMLVKLYDTLDNTEEIDAWSPRVKMMAMFSNFVATTNIRLNGVYPEREVSTVPLVLNRVLEGGERDPFVKRGYVQVPELLAKPMNIKVGDTVVLVATNREGSVNGKTFVVSGILESISGPGGRDGYIHIEDARELLRIEDDPVDREVLEKHGMVKPKPADPEPAPLRQSLLSPGPPQVDEDLLAPTQALFEQKNWGRPSEVSEIAIRLKDFDALDAVLPTVNADVADLKNRRGLSIFQIHDWKRFVPFSKIANMIDVMVRFVYVILILVVLISILNVMMMAVYERIREIGTISAIGTSPGKILALFVTEGFLLGVLGTAIATILSLAVIKVVQFYPIPFSFGRQENLLLVPEIGATDVILAGLLTIFVGVLASLQPAWKASRMDPITALRHV